MARRIVTGEDVQSLPEGAILDLPEGAILTDIAREMIATKHIRVVTGAGSLAEQPPRKVRVALGADHGGYEMKEALKSLLREWDASYIDCGTHSTRSVDYPDFAHAVGLAVALGKAELGIVIDGAGIGSAMAANKIPGIRAAPCPDEATARNSREHNDANVLTLGARLLSRETMKKVVQIFLNTTISEPRHQARVRKIIDIERKYYRRV
jgi:ribose 5-phosphate isomerase B